MKPPTPAVRHAGWVRSIQRTCFLYMISIIVSCIGETWVYYLLGSLIEVTLLVVIARAAWRWPAPTVAPSLP